METSLKILKTWAPEPDESQDICFSRRWQVRDFIAEAESGHANLPSSGDETFLDGLDFCFLGLNKRASAKQKVESYKQLFFSRIGFTKMIGLRDRM